MFLKINQFLPVLKINKYNVHVKIGMRLFGDFYAPVSKYPIKSANFNNRGRTSIFFLRTAIAAEVSLAMISLQVFSSVVTSRS